MSKRRICLAGYLGDRTCIRPVAAHGHVDEDWLRVGAAGIIRPFTVIELDVGDAVGIAPHTEDRVVGSGPLILRYLLDPRRRQRALSMLDDGGVALIFGTSIQRDSGWFVSEGEGYRSLGTVSPAEIHSITFALERTGWAYRLDFTDQLGERYRLAVTDLAFRYFLDHSRVRHSMAPDTAAGKLLAGLESSEVFLRIGLARGWADHPDRCHLQITGVYSFPDYLDGRCWADLALTPDELDRRRSPTVDDTAALAF